MPSAFDGYFPNSWDDEKRERATWSVCRSCKGSGNAGAAKTAEGDMIDVDCPDCRGRGRTKPKSLDKPHKSSAVRYAAATHALAELQAAAMKVIEETDRIHDEGDYPTKYRAPYGAITELRALLAKQLGAR